MHLPNNTLLQGGKYKITRFIASGGFGCTYEAEHVMLRKRVAIKEFFVKDFCNRDEATSHVTVGTQSKVALVSKLKKKFIEEASALSRFNHPNIVYVSDVFEENGTAYYVMDFIDGKSIHEILKTQPTIPEAQAIKYITQIAEALKQVHAQNRLHLDIKPGNIIIDSNDNAILIDFGASKQYDEVDGENTSTLIGRTPGYAPLEQLGNDIVKFMPAADIYALGATLYKMLTGKTPLSATLLASGESLEPLPNHISKETRNAVMACMVTNKTKRPQSIEELLALLSSNTPYVENNKILNDFEDNRVDASLKSRAHESQKIESVKDSISTKFGFGFKFSYFVVSAFTCLMIAILTSQVWYCMEHYNAGKVVWDFTEDGLSNPHAIAQRIDCTIIIPVCFIIFILYVMTTCTLFKRKLDSVFLCKLLLFSLALYSITNALLSLVIHGPGSIGVLIVCLIWYAIWYIYISVSKRIAKAIPKYSRKLYIRDYIISIIVAILFIIMLYFYIDGFMIVTKF